MDKDFVAADKGYRKLKFAEETHAAVYLYGATGYGKTKLVHEYLGNREVLWLTAMDQEWDFSIEEGMSIVVDDLQMLKSEEQKEILLKLTKRKDIWLILIGRMQTPIWLVPVLTDGHLIVITEEDLHLSVDEVRKIAANEGVELKEEDAKIIVDSGCGCVYAAVGVIQLMRSGESFDEDMWSKIHNMFVKHLETNIISQWSTDLQEFLMQLSVVDEFTIPLAVMITGDNHAPLMLEQAFEAGNFLQREGECYKLRPELVEALRSKALKLFGVKKYQQYINNAGLYFEMQNDYECAIRLYESADNQEGIRSILIRSARRHPGAINLYDLHRYYLALEEKQIENSPVLMSVMSMIYSIMMNQEKSEYWYGKLKSYGESVKGGERREVDEQLLYLDIALPHRGSLDLADILKRTAGLIKSGGLTLPEFSITSNQPSTMNGGKDFCNWSKRDQFMADTIGKLVEKLMGPMGRGLIHAALCESFYEKGGRDEEVLHHAIMHQMAVESGGKIEVLFATVGIQVRLNLLSGNTVNALQILNSFEARVRKEQFNQLIPNIEALKCRLALVTGEDEIADKWMEEEAPNEQMEFWSMDRYRYLTKVRCYLAYGQNREAINLLQRLLYYADISKRVYVRMEAKLLMAIALRREKMEWKCICLEALNEIQEYSFVRIISEKGAGIVPLLKEIRKSYLEQENADRKWFEVVKKEAEQIGERYPGYLVCDSVQPKDFTETALSILRMQSDGLSIKVIAERLDLSERTVKYHASENYRKLGAKGKTDAVQIARSLNLL